MDNRTAMLQRIKAYDFAMLEMNLYLDTHPEDCQALALFKMYREKRMQLIAEYEALFGPYINTVDDVQGDSFAWICDPWPWDYCREA